MNTPNIPQHDKADNIEGDLDAVRTYLHQAGVALLEAANSDNPLVTAFGQVLAERLGLAPKPGARLRRSSEVFVLQCHRCEREISIPTTRPYRCPHCACELEIQWGGAE